MRTYKKILLALFVAASMGSFSSVTLAEKAKYPPAEVIDKIVGKVNEANALMAAGGESREDVINLIKEAQTASKEVSANDKVDFKRQRVQGELKQAMVKVKAGEAEAGMAILKKALETLAEMKSLI
ncbi:MAG: hypothetical protein NTV00_14670 [Methylococcales bacterium]|nr:hypothetical protein [Methylococcales bacterium]